MDEWNPQISKSIIESWGFPSDVVDSADTSSYADQDIAAVANMVDIMLAYRDKLQSMQQSLV